MRRVILTLLAVGLIGCKGPAGSQGPKGDKGSTGIPGPGAFAFLSGNVTSDDFTVTDSRINLADQIGVYIGDGTNATELPYFLPSKGINTFYVFRSGQVEIVNAVQAGATKYVIELILP